jgi:hypothetical protein
MVYFKIGNKDFSDMVSGMKIGYETLVSDNSGRNAAGDTVVDVVNKKRKLYITFRHTFSAEMKELLAAIESYVVTVSYLDSKTNTLQSMNCYTGTPEPELYTLSGDGIYKPMNLNFIEL